MKIRLLPLCLLCLLSNCTSTEGPGISDAVLIRNLYPDHFNTPQKIDSSILSIRVSSKRVMQGFINTNMPTQGAFANLIHIFTGFKNSDHNPKAKTEVRFFNGDNNGKLQESIGNDLDTIGNQLFNTNNYTAKTNNLHFQFNNISRELKSRLDSNKFYVIFSDGETTIRSQQNMNRTEFAEVKESIKDILQTNSNIEIGIISLLADFNGDYVYDPNQEKKIACKRYLYAYCIFDKRFLSEFNRFCELNKRNGGENILFNPKFSIYDIETKYQPEFEGQNNSSTDAGYSAYVVEMDGKPHTYSVLNSPVHKNINFDSTIEMVITRRDKNTDTTYATGEVIEKKLIPFTRDTLTFTLNGLNKSSLVSIDFFHKFEQSNINHLKLLTQDINDNTIANVAQLNLTDTLKTEGLRDLCEMIGEALQESKKIPVFSNYIKFEKFK